MTHDPSPHVETRVRVRYKETDQMGIAHHANYLVWFELGRTDLCREVGVSYRAIEDDGFLLVVTEVQCRYRIPYRYDDEVLIRTSVGRNASRSLRFDYRLLDAGGSIIHAEGSSSHLWLDHVTRRPVSGPRELITAFRRFSA
ncbi:MAG TPA: thioesterase family protein [Thermoanaerobaculia bacterium]|nr:thioesterase family protein [Thermoanaerobaculia bacterium]